MQLRLLLLGIVFQSTPLFAEVVTDGTLGTQLNLPGPVYEIDAGLGKQVGANLFHSFTTFGLTAQERAIFSGPVQIEHIIGRVTGGQASKIDGTLESTIAGSQLWMFNPAGWEQLGAIEVPGNLAHAPAEALRLKDGGLFHATQPENSLLTAAPPAGFLGIRQTVLVPDVTRETVSDRGEEMEGESLSFFLVQNERLQDMSLEVSACDLRNENQTSHFYINRYRGTPVGPDEWQSSDLILSEM